MGRLTVGNISSGGLPTRGSIGMFRYGNRWLSSYEYDTLDLRKIHQGMDGPEHHVVDEVERFFSRDTDYRMTTGAVMFAPFGPDDIETYYMKDDAEPMLHDDEGIAYRTHGLNNPEQEAVGLQFRLTQLEHDSVAWFDNSRFMISNILWEFSPDGGRGKWYQLYEMPNRKDTRITLPEQTNQIKLRAVSNNPDEWVQALAVTPIVDWQNRFDVPLEWSDGVGEISMDSFGFINWPEAFGGMGDIAYELYGQYEGAGYEITQELAMDEEPTTEDKMLLFSCPLMSQNSIAAEISSPFDYAQFIYSSREHAIISQDDILIEYTFDKDDLDDSSIYAMNPNPSVESQVKYAFFAVYFENDDQLTRAIAENSIHAYKCIVHDDATITKALARTKGTSLSPDEYRLPSDSIDLWVTAYDTVASIESSVKHINTWTWSDPIDLPEPEDKWYRRHYYDIPIGFGHAVKIKMEKEFSSIVISHEVPIRAGVYSDAWEETIPYDGPGYYVSQSESWEYVSISIYYNEQEPDYEEPVVRFGTKNTSTGDIEWPDTAELIEYTAMVGENTYVYQYIETGEGKRIKINCDSGGYSFQRVSYMTVTHKKKVGDKYETVYSETLGPMKDHIYTFSKDTTGYANISIGWTDKNFKPQRTYLRLGEIVL